MRPIAKVYNLLPTGIKVFLFRMFRMDKPCGYGEKYRDVLDSSLEMFLTDNEKNDSHLVKRLTKDIIECWVLYKALPYEYFCFGFRSMPDEKRATFITDVDKNRLCAKYSNLSAYRQEICDKYAFYKLMQPFFHRDVFLLDSHSDVDAFSAFALSAKSVFCKLNSGSRGRDAFLRRIETVEDAGTLFNELSRASGETWLVEEKIEQSPLMSQWNPSSVNSVRLPAFLTKNGFKVLCPFLRTGRAGSVVDNAGGGGIFAVIDPESGEIVSDGVDEQSNFYVSHPDSGLTFKGWKVPRWDELLQVAEKAHRMIPHHKYIGWDFALTEDGWVLIEGNWGQMVGQYATRIGVRKEFTEYIIN